MITDTPSALLSHALSPWGMFVAADWVVQTVMIGLLLAAVMTWVVWLSKTRELRAARREIVAALATLQNSASLSRLAEDEAIRGAGGKNGSNGSLQLLRETVMREWQDSDGLSIEGIKERAAASLGRVEAALGRRIGRGIGVLATIGAVTPFVGLFGTVWGIMNAFIGISKSQTTNLAVVAPGIAEALLATALGLFAAIPAVVIYNAFSRSILAYRALIADASTQTLNLLGRDLERGR